jgi:hypothetical protein
MSFFTRSRQPYYARANQGGLGAGMQMLLHPMGHAVIDVVTGTLWANNGGANANKATSMGRAATFDGTDDFYSYTGYPNIVGNVGTFFAWLPRLGAYDTNGVVLWGSNTTTQVYFQLENSVVPRIACFGGGGLFNSTTDLRNSTNLALCFVSNGTTQTLYVNGVVDASANNAPAAFPAGSKSFRFGAWVGGNTFDCNMDCVVAGFTNRAWGAPEAKAFYQNPFQLYTPQARRTYFLGIAGGATIHDTSGDLVGQGAVVDGSAAHIAIHGTTGVLVGQGAAIEGAAELTPLVAEHVTSGALVGQGAVLDGTAAHIAIHVTSGVLVGPGAAVDGTALRLTTHETSGILVGQGSIVRGIAANGSAQIVIPGGVKKKSLVLVSYDALQRMPQDFLGNWTMQSKSSSRQQSASESRCLRSRHCRKSQARSLFKQYERFPLRSSQFLMSGPQS